MWLSTSSEMCSMSKSDAGLGRNQVDVAPGRTQNMDEAHTK